MRSPWRHSTKGREAGLPIGDDLRPECQFDYQPAKPTRFASAMGQGTVAVVLDPDVASVFHTSESVNNLLRSVISAVPTPRPSPGPTARRKKAGASETLGSRRPRALVWAKTDTTTLGTARERSQVGCGEDRACRSRRGRSNRRMTLHGATARYLRD
jgi:hypothetical protein